MPDSSIILPIFDVQKVTPISITSHNAQDDFPVEDDLTINNHDPKGCIFL